MAYGRDAQAEEILKEALQKDANRIPVHAKLLEIYAQRKDAKAFEQTALKLKSLTNGSRPGMGEGRRARAARSIRRTALYAAHPRSGGSARRRACARGGRRADARLRPRRRQPRRPPRPTSRSTTPPRRSAARRLDFDLGVDAARSAAERRRTSRPTRPDRGRQGRFRRPRLQSGPRRRGEEAGAAEGRRAAPAPAPNRAAASTSISTSTSTSRRRRADAPSRAEDRPFLDQPGSRRPATPGDGAEAGERPEVAGSRDQARPRQGLRGNGRQGRRARAAEGGR